MASRVGEKSGLRCFVNANEQKLDEHRESDRNAYMLFYERVDVCVSRAQTSFAGRHATIADASRPKTLSTARYSRCVFCRYFLILFICNLQTGVLLWWWSRDDTHFLCTRFDKSLTELRSYFSDVRVRFKARRKCYSHSNVRAKSAFYLFNIRLRKLPPSTQASEGTPTKQPHAKVRRTFTTGASPLRDESATGRLVPSALREQIAELNVQFVRDAHLYSDEYRHMSTSLSELCRRFVRCYTRASTRAPRADMQCRMAPRTP